MKNKIQLVLLLLFILFSTNSFAQEVFLDADNTGNAYNRITSKLFNYEVPDCWHNVVHMTEGWDSFLNKYVFLFNLHWADGIGGTASPVNDNDRCMNYDRQRTEMKVDGSSPAYMQGQYGDTHHYRWKFKVDSSFQTETSFTHVHQLKAGDGTVDTDNPLITISLIKSKQGIDSLQLRYISTIESGSVTIHLKDAVLAPILGNWVEVYETVKYSDTGSYSVTIKKVSDETVLFTYTNNNIWLWRTGITFVRPKWGLYRSLIDSTHIRSETVKFADFALVEGTTSSTPAAPGNLTASVLSGGKIKLTWIDNSSNEDQYRINRSVDSTTWTYLTTSPAQSTSYIDTGLSKSTTYYYQIRAENAIGNSIYSSAAGIITSLHVKQTSFNPVPQEYTLSQNFPNPFNPNTMIRYSIPQRSFVTLKVYDILGKEIATLINGELNAGQFQIEFNSKNVASGIYYCQLKSGDFLKTIKMIFMK